MPINKHESLLSSNDISSAMASQTWQSSFDPYDLSGDDIEYSTPNNASQTTAGRNDLAALILSAASLYLISPPEAPQRWGQINPNLTDYHSERMEYSSTWWLPDISDRWRQQEETHSTYAEPSDVARDKICILTHGLGVEASFYFARDVRGQRKSKTTRKTLRKKVVVRQFVQGNNRILAGTDPQLENANTENDSEIEKDAEERKLHKMAKVHPFLMMWQGS